MTSSGIIYHMIKKGPVRIYSGTDFDQASKDFNDF